MNKLKIYKKRSRSQKSASFFIFFCNCLCAYSVYYKQEVFVFYNLMLINVSQIITLIFQLYLNPLLLQPYQILFQIKSRIPLHIL